MAVSTYSAVLKWGITAENVAQESGFKIQNYPDLGGAPDMLETTTLEDAAQTFINGIKKNGAMEFDYLYDKTVYGLVAADADTVLYYSLEFGVDGATCKATWQGMHSTYVTGKGVNEVMQAKLVIAPSTAITIA